MSSVKFDIWDAPTGEKSFWMGKMKHLRQDLKQTGEEAINLQPAGDAEERA